MATHCNRGQKDNSLSRGCVISVLVLLLSVFASYGAAHNGLVEEEQDLAKVDWWKKTNFYHIYLRSFKDSDGDGNGDLRGVIEELDYLKQIGVETILMSPFYSSPMKDGGYDIEDHVAVHPRFGTMADFDELVDKLKKRKMRIVLDFVPNHTSDQHPWFKCSERALIDPVNCGKYRDYYVWSSSTRYQGKYPSNWISVFGGGPAWAWSEIRQQFYLHQFLPEQPDLNFTNPAVKEEFNNIARFWLRKGVDGLRLDAVLHLIEDPNFTDEPENPDWEVGDDPWLSQLHMNTTMFRRESAEVVGEWRKLIEKEFPDDNKVIIAEIYGDIPKLIEYYGNGPDDRYSDLPFNSELFALNKNNLRADYIEEIALSWIQPTLELGWPKEQGAMSPWILWMLGNHDNARVANKAGSENVFLLQLLMYILPGVPLNYYGDELPLKNGYDSDVCQQTLDEGEQSRLQFRVPMAWNDDRPSAGFSSRAKPWLPVNRDCQTNNVKHLLSDSSDPKNGLKMFVELQNLRQRLMDIFVFGDLVFFHNQAPDDKMVLAVARTHEKFGNLLMLANLDPYGKARVHLDPSISIIDSKPVEPPHVAEVVLLNLIDKLNAPEVDDGVQVQIDGLVLAPLQTVLVKYDGDSLQGLMKEKRAKKPSAWSNIMKKGRGMLKCFGCDSMES